MEKQTKALQYAEDSLDKYSSSVAIAEACEEILLACSKAEEAYRRYGIEANHKTTYLATFRAIAKKYPHKTAKDFKMKEPLFAVEAGIAALHWLVAGYGYEITRLDVHNAYSFTMEAAENRECRGEVLERIQSMVARATLETGLLLTFSKGNSKYQLEKKRP